MSRPETLQHALLHVVKYVGEMANIVEKFDHPHEQDRAVLLAHEFLEKRPEHMAVCFQAFVQYLQEAAYDPEKRPSPTQEAMS